MIRRSLRNRCQFDRIGAGGAGIRRPPRAFSRAFRISLAALGSALAVQAFGCAGAPTPPAGDASGAAGAQAAAAAPDPDREACARGEGPACERAADVYRRGDPRAVSKARPDADAELFRSVCEKREVAGACTALAWTLFPTDVPHAIALFLRACAGGSARACASLGAAYEAGTGVPKDDPRAAKMYQGACDMGLGDACDHVGHMLESGRGVTADPAAAAAAFAKACDGGVPDACASIAIATGLGNGVARDEAKAAALFQKGCEGGSQRACSGLGVAYSYGRGVIKDDTRAAELLKKPCSNGDDLSCRELASILGNLSSPARDDRKALVLYLRACDDNDLAGCSSAAGLISAGRGVDADPTRAAWLWTKACVGGNATGCTWLGLSLLRGQGAHKNVAKASALLEKACQGGHASACDFLGTLYAFGDGVARDNAKAESLFRSACELGSATGCSRLGLCYQNRKAGGPSYDFGIAQAAADCKRTALACEWLGGVPRERAEEAFKLLTQACDTEIPAACASLARAVAAGRVPKTAASALMTEIRGRCEQGKALWCRRLAFWHEEGLSVPKSEPIARDFYKRACDGGDARACGDFGRMLATGAGGKRDVDAAIVVLKGACDQGGEGTVACGHLGMIYLNDGKPEDHDLGSKLLDRACSQHDGLACDRLGGFFAVGAKGFPKDERRAANLFELACSYGGLACDEARRLREQFGIDDLR